MKKPIYNVCVLGIWHLGAVVSACLAELGYAVIGVDSNYDRVKKLNAGIPPIFEPGLEELIKKHLTSGRLSYNSDFEKSVQNADCVMFCYDTPVDMNDDLDMSPVVDAAEAVSPFLTVETLVIVQSQVPVGSCEKLGNVLRNGNASRCRHVAYVPENLRLGQGISRFMEPTMIVIGSDDPSITARTESFLSVLPGARVLTNLRTAEMTKHALNAFFATSISFANELGNICDDIGADGLKVSEALRLDERIGPNAFVLPGGPFGGGTLARDLRVLKGLGEASGYETTLFDAVIKVNEKQKDLVVTRLQNLYGELKGLNIGVLGLTYKPGTSTLRRSPSLDIIVRLAEAGAIVKAYDPKADLSELGTNLPFEFCSDAYKATNSTDAIVIATEWPEFRDIDFAQVRAEVNRAVILDTKNLLDPEELEKLGFVYMGTGRGTRGKHLEE